MLHLSKMWTKIAVQKIHARGRMPCKEYIMQPACRPIGRKSYVFVRKCLSW